MEIQKYIQAITDVAIANEAKLNALDAAIGDGDFGSNAVRGFKSIAEHIDAFTAESSIEADLLMCGKQLMSQIGGSSGLLMGAAFIAMATSLKGKTSFSNQDIANALQNACNRISQLGKAKVGEKTMLDALTPVVAALQNTQTTNLDFASAAKAAMTGAQSTVDMQPFKGRASYLGERAIGHMDAGAFFVALIFQRLNEI
ncbi:MAG: dihydroxyacetone kinase subunit L [Mycoplasmataceae bacterium]|jgi:dihydroxyacetone kinase-like protein|nr:dihydroxyacetone kinase subunit L [Mycoplasmataceae bacterium]